MHRSKTRCLTAALCTVLCTCNTSPIIVTNRLSLCLSPSVSPLSFLLLSLPHSLLFPPLPPFLPLPFPSLSFFLFSLSSILSSTFDSRPFFFRFFFYFIFLFFFIFVSVYEDFFLVIVNQKSLAYLFGKTFLHLNRKQFMILYIYIYSIIVCNVV